MKALTAIAATAYAIGLWMFAPQSVWERELATAKRNQQRRLTPTPEPLPDTVPTPAPETQAEPTPKQTPEPTVQAETEPTPQPSEVTAGELNPVTLETFTPDDLVITEAEIKELLPDTIWTEPDTSEATPEEPQQPDYTGWTITQLRELAKQRKLNWRPLVNGKRTPLKKPQLIALLTA